MNLPVTAIICDHTLIMQTIFSMNMHIKRSGSMASLDVKDPWFENWRRHKPSLRGSQASVKPTAGPKPEYTGGLHQEWGKSAPN